MTRLCMRTKPAIITTRIMPVVSSVASPMARRSYLRAFFKPISTLGKPLDSVNLKTKRKSLAPYVRSDICIVPAGGVVCEAVVALVIADLISEKFGGDSMRETLANYHSYLKYVRAR